jgi:hypothetical protein
MPSTKPASKAAQWLAQPRPSVYGVRCTVCQDAELAAELETIFAALAADPAQRKVTTITMIRRDFVVGVMGRSMHENTLYRHRRICLAHLGPW